MLVVGVNSTCVLIGGSILTAGTFTYCCCQRMRDKYLLRRVHRRLLRRALELQDGELLSIASCGLPSKPLMSRGTEGDASPSPMLVATMEYLFSRRTKSMQSKEFESFSRSGPESLTPIDCCAAGALACLWPGVSANKRHVIIYISGSGYSTGSIETSRAFAGQLSKLMQCPVIIPRLLGTSNVADEIQNVTQCLQWLSSKVVDRSISIVADSFGCEIAIGTVAKNESLKANKRVGCNSLILISPILLSYTASSARLREANNDRDPMFPGYASVYINFKKRLSGVHSMLPQTTPPVLFISSESEFFATSIRKTYLNARRVSIPCEHVITPHTPHCLPLYCNVFPEGRDSLNKITSFVESHLSVKVPSRSVCE